MGTPPNATAPPANGPPMLEFVRRAFEEGGPQMAFLVSLLDTPDLSKNLPIDERIYVVLAELLKLRSTVTELQAQVSDLTNERDKMTVLIWTELLRLADKVDSFSSGASAQVRAAVSQRLIESKGPASTELMRSVSSALNEHVDRPNKRARYSAEVRLHHDSSPPDRRTSRKTDEPEMSSSPASRSDCGSMEIKRTSLVLEGPGGQCNDQNVLIQSWLEKQMRGRKSEPELAERQTGWSNDDWYCYVCGTVARDGPPGDHFCWGRMEEGSANESRGIKVFCQYCRKGTSRMPDLRVHFRKIVYCRLLRTELKRIYKSVLGVPPFHLLPIGDSPPMAQRNEDTLPVKTSSNSSQSDTVIDDQSEQTSRETVESATKDVKVEPPSPGNEEGAFYGATQIKPDVVSESITSEDQLDDGTSSSSPLSQDDVDVDYQLMDVVRKHRKGKGYHLLETVNTT